MDIARVQQNFAQKFGKNGVLYAAPGRMNLIGEHTDYNGGFVLPGAIDKGILVGLRANGTDKIRVYSLDFDAYAEFGLAEEDRPEQTWARYIFGVAREMIKRGGSVQGFDAVFTGDVPNGSGLSSSAALESAFGTALNDTFGLGFDKMELAKIGQATECSYVGVKCGIMDQFASVFGKKDYLMRLDCRSLEYEYVPCKLDGYKLVLVDSRVKHQLVNNPYNRRRESCEAVVKAVAQNHAGVSLLREVTPDMLREVKSKVSAEDYMRAEFVVGEIARVVDVCEALQKGDFTTVGKKMYETHEGLSKQYEVSCAELDFLSEQARHLGVAGSRIMGGGFGGCTINLVPNDKLAAFEAEIVPLFNSKFGIVPKIYDVVLSDGARKISE